jgi:hypothetical protein
MIETSSRYASNNKPFEQNDNVEPDVKNNPDETLTSNITSRNTAKP